MSNSYYSALASDRSIWRLLMFYLLLSNSYYSALASDRSIWWLLMFYLLLSNSYYSARKAIAVFGGY
ncbi:MAG: hypothetical protein F6K17_41980 [Okeania sp. SIO3C4]|nr:hypothetical protein [Okeania sp. SIO3C4]